MITAIIVQQIGIGGAIVNRILSNALGFGLLSLIILSIFWKPKNEKSEPNQQSQNVDEPINDVLTDKKD